MSALDHTLQHVRALTPLDMGIVQRRAFNNTVRKINEGMLYAYSINQDFVRIDEGSTISDSTLSYALLEFRDPELFPRSEGLDTMEQEVWQYGWEVTSERIDGDIILRFQPRVGALVVAQVNDRSKEDPLDDVYTYAIQDSDSPTDGDWYISTDDTNEDIMKYSIIFE